MNYTVVDCWATSYMVELAVEGDRITAVGTGLLECKAVFEEVKYTPVERRCLSRSESVLERMIVAGEDQRLIADK